LGITPELNKAQIKVLDTSNGFPHKETFVDAEWFSEYDPFKSDKQPNDLLTGSMQFLYLNLDGSQQDYKYESKGWPKHYHIYRLHPDKATKKRKYFQPAKSGSHLFHTPGIIYNYTNQIKPIGCI